MFMTLIEAAEYFRVHPETVRNWLRDARKGKSNFPLPITPPRKKILFRKHEIIYYDNTYRKRTETPTQRVVKKNNIKSKLVKHGVVMR